MSRKAHGQIRRSQVITIWGPGALLDLPRYAVIVGGLDTWPKASDLEEISESRLAHKLQISGWLRWMGGRVPTTLQGPAMRLRHQPHIFHRNKGRTDRSTHRSARGQTPNTVLTRMTSPTRC